MRVIALVLCPVIGLFSLWVAYTGKPVYGSLTSAAPRTPMPKRQGRTMATIVGVGFLLLFLLALFTK
jgi:hypothetical protein